MSSKIILDPTNEETVQCLFFSKTLVSEISLWEDLCQQINSTIKMLSTDYIWHRDEFKVFIPITGHKDTKIPFHLCSLTCFGDNIEDEWFIVWLVLEISRLYQDLIIHMQDTDGGFLLIEAADYLQTWANPENTENRVFIYRNHIHVIPPEVVPLETKLDLKTAVKILNELSESTQVANDVEQAVLNRIGSYPEKLNENIHKTIVQLPSNLAALLILKPTLIAPIVNAYCHSDVIDAKCVKKIDFSDCVTVEVKFTKLLYAMLLHSKLINCVKQYESKNDKGIILGVKIACGYQMIMNKASTDMFSSKEYNSFLTNLKQNGYFQNKIEGSIEYNQLLKNAKEYFSLTESPVSSHVSHSISELMSSSDYISIRDSVKDKSLVESGYVGDNDDWLNIHPDQLNDLLLTRYGKKSTLKSNDIISPETITTELSSILKQTSDYEGIEPDCKEKSEDNKIEFESDEFVSCIEKMLNILSTGCDQNTESEDSEEDYDEMEENEDNFEVCDEEMKAKLQINHSENLHESKTILSNIMESIEEERASTGPTSNLLRTFGVSEFLDSDDDVD